MKIKPILTAFAVTLSVLASTAMAVETFTQDAAGNLTHVRGIPIDPIQTTEQARINAEKHIAAMKAKEATQAAAKHATRNPLPTTAPQELFFTGKPYLEETGQYLFLFRHYDPELSRWTTADPSGFPDGANIYHYAPRMGSGIDYLGLAAKSVINNLSDALEHWSSNAGGAVPASYSVHQEIMAYNSYADRGTELVELWQTLLITVPKSLSSGRIDRDGITWGVSGPLNPPKTVGSVNLAFPSYGINWNASSWHNGARVISASGMLAFSYNDEFDFVFDPNEPLKTFFTDVIPSWWAGEGTPFQITGNFTDTFYSQAVQYE